MAGPPAVVGANGAWRMLPYIAVAVHFTFGGARCPIAYGERIGSSFPGDEFLSFLREAGARDVQFLAKPIAA